MRSESCTSLKLVIRSASVAKRVAGGKKLCDIVNDLITGNPEQDLVDIITNNILDCLRIFKNGYVTLDDRFLKSSINRKLWVTIELLNSIVR